MNIEKSELKPAPGVGSSVLLDPTDISLKRELLPNTTVYDVGVCRTSKGEKGISINMHLCHSSPIRLESLHHELNMLKPLIEGLPHRITITADSSHFGPLLGSVPTNDFVSCAHKGSNAGTQRPGSSDSGNATETPKPGSLE